jgi:hypothetical protein
MMTRTLVGWQLAFVVCVVPFLGGCALAPSRPTMLQPTAIRLAIQQATLVRLDYVAPPVAANGLQSMRASMSGGGRGGTIAALVFWDRASSAVPLGGDRATATSVQVTRLPGGLLALRRLNVLVLYTPGSKGPNLTPSLRRALADAPLR